MNTRRSCLKIFPTVIIRMFNLSYGKKRPPAMWGAPVRIAIEMQSHMIAVKGELSPSASPSKE